MSIYEDIYYSINKNTLYTYKTNKYGVMMGTWTPYLKRVMSDLLDYLESLSAEFKEGKAFINSEFDSQQTNFERKSTNMDIGAQATNNVTGHTLLFFMRMIIDNRPDLFLDCLEQNNEDFVIDDGSVININQMIDVLKYYESDQTKVMEIKEIDPDCQIDLWDIARVRAELKKIKC